MLGRDLSRWWDGHTALDGGAKHEYRAPAPAFGPDAAKEELFGHLRCRVLANPEVQGRQHSRKRTDLAAFNDGSMLSMSNNVAPAPAPGSYVSHAPPFAPERHGGNPTGVYDPNTDWRAGDTKPLTINGKERADANKPPADIQHMAERRMGDRGQFGFDSLAPSSALPAAQVNRPGGVGRRVHSAIMPYNDGSQLAMQQALTEQRGREKYNTKAHVMGSGSRMEVDAMPRDEHARIQVHPTILPSYHPTILRTLYAASSI